MSSRRHGVNVARVLLTGKRVGAKVASEVDSPALTGLRRDCGTPHLTPSEGPRVTAGEAKRGSVDQSTSSADLPGGGPDAA